MQNTPPSIPASKPSDSTNEYAPLPQGCGVFSILESLLKCPARLAWEIHNGKAALIIGILAGLTVLALGFYGLVVGSLTGGSQYWIAPAKIILGSFLSLLICLPSLFIFMCLNGSKTNFITVIGAAVAATCLAALLLISLAPVAWVFSQSTDSIGFMASMHLIFWSIAVGFGMRLLGITEKGGTKPARLAPWIFVYILVSLQMMTALRPIIGHSDTFLPEKKQFFLEHWATSLSASVK